MFDLNLAEALFNPYVAGYLGVVAVTPFVVSRVGAGHRREVAQRRRQRGLPDDVLLDHAVRLANVRQESRFQALALVLAVLVTPFALYLIARGQRASDETLEGLALTFVSLLLWLLFTGTDVAKAFLGGLAFKTLAAFKGTIQQGDRVTLQGHSGKITAIDLFHVTLQTGTDDLVSIPTAGLWSEALVSANAGERASLCVMEFFLAPTVTHEERQRAEDIIWGAIQASPYLEASKPMQILLSQDPRAIRLTAHAYVASTYDEPLFRSDVSRAFLDFASKSDIPLATYP